jgi:hypothetical protein
MLRRQNVWRSSSCGARIAYPDVDRPVIHVEASGAGQRHYDPKEVLDVPLVDAHAQLFYIREGYLSSNVDKVSMCQASRKE